MTKPEPVRSKSPNIILVMADDLGFETLGTYKGSSYETPNLDQLASDGMRFDHCYSTPLCTPSRVQLMTGRYNHRNYIGFGLLDPNEKTFAHYLKEAGYKTFVAGKWQLFGNANQQQLAGDRKGTTPEKAGFDDFCLWQIDHRGSRYKNPTLSSKAGTIVYGDEFGPDIFVDRIETFMDDNKEDPFFIYYPMVLTHDPFVPTPDNEKFKSFDPTLKVNDTAYFGEMVHYMDKLVGRIRTKVEELGIQDNTLLLFVGDNGTDRDVTSANDGKTIRGNKGYTSDAGTHVPLIAFWDGKIKKESINGNLIDFTDFLPTVLEAATQSKLDSTLTDGHSFYPQLLGDDSEARQWIFCHYEPHWGNFSPRRYVQNTKWKLYENGEFYNLENDITEQNPLNTDVQPKTVREIHDQFQKVLAKYPSTP
ncbi:MAG: sulfatase-like hydrolase/transferase [Maribacter sp.]|nr:sulfatase-like hydrolase/transferase [Maribacter sp.]